MFPDLWLFHILFHRINLHFIHPFSQVFHCLFHILPCEIPCENEELVSHGFHIFFFHSFFHMPVKYPVVTWFSHVVHMVFTGFLLVVPEQDHDCNKDDVEDGEEQQD